MCRIIARTKCHGDIGLLDGAEKFAKANIDYAYHRYHRGDCVRLYILLVARRCCKVLRNNDNTEQGFYINDTHVTPARLCYELGQPGSGFVDWRPTIATLLMIRHFNSIQRIASA